MNDKYTAEQYETEALVAARAGAHGWARMLRQAAQMMREREVGGAASDVTYWMREQAATLHTDNFDCDGPAANHKLAYAIEDAAAALESFVARRAAVPDAIVELSECRKAGWNDSAPAYRAGWNACRAAMLAAAPR